MMEAGRIGNLVRRVHRADTHFRQMNPSTVFDPQAVTAHRTVKDPAKYSAVIPGGFRGTGPLYPTLDAEVLQLKVGRITNIYSTSTTTDAKSLTHLTTNECYRFNQCSRVWSHCIGGITLGPPPTHD